MTTFPEKHPPIFDRVNCCTELLSRDGTHGLPLPVGLFPDISISMQVHSYGGTDVGRMRRRNEDAFLDDTEHRLYAVADGLGGLAAGDRASALAISILKIHRDDSASEGHPLDFRRVFADAHKAIQKLGAEADPVGGAGTTLTVALLHEHKIVLAHAGDSAAYSFKSDGWEKLTRDHTEAENFRNTWPGQPVPPIYEHTLTGCLGQPGRANPDFFSHPFESGDRLLLCSDGATRHVHPEEIADLSQKSATPKDLVDEIIELANERGGADNITAVAIFID